MHVFGQWEEAGVPGKTPCIYGENMQTPHRNAPAGNSTWNPSRCEATVLTTTPPCSTSGNNDIKKKIKFQHGHLAAVVKHQFCHNNVKVNLPEQYQHHESKATKRNPNIILLLYAFIRNQNVVYKKSCLGRAFLFFSQYFNFPVQKQSKQKSHTSV